MKIRFLIPEDAGDGLVCGSRLSSVTPEAFSASLDEYRSLTLEDIRKRLWSDEDAFVVGAFEDGRLIGVAGFYREKGAKSHHKGSILGVYVTPRSRGAGIGKKIMQTLLERGSTIEGVEQLLLSVAATQTSAIRLYRSLAFESFGTGPRALRIDDRYIDEDRMVLRLMNFAGSGKYAPEKGKSALDVSVQDASAALPQNCQTTIG